MNKNQLNKLPKYVLWDMSLSLSYKDVIELAKTNRHLQNSFMNDEYWLYRLGNLFAPTSETKKIWFIKTISEFVYNDFWYKRRVYILPSDYYKVINIENGVEYIRGWGDDINKIQVQSTNIKVPKMEKYGIFNFVQKQGNTRVYQCELQPNIFFELHTSPYPVRDMPQFGDMPTLNLRPFKLFFDF